MLIWDDVPKKWLRVLVDLLLDAARFSPSLASSLHTRSGWDVWRRGAKMSLSLKFVRVLALGAWVGAIVYFAAVVTRGGFAVLPSRDEAGLLVGFTLAGLHVMGLILASISVIASVALAKSLKAFVDPTVLGVILMALLTIASQYYVMPRLAGLRSQMGSVDGTPSSDPRRAEFDRLHSASVDLEGTVLAIGLITLFLTLREDQSPA